MVSCKEVLEELSNYLDNEVDPGLRAEIEAHLRMCRRCSVLADSTRKVLYIYADERAFEIPVGYIERLHEFLQRAMENPH